LSGRFRLSNQQSQLSRLLKSEAELNCSALIAIKRDIASVL
jgi:hypothetical protein